MMEPTRDVYRPLGPKAIRVRLANGVRGVRFRADPASRVDGAMNVHEPTFIGVSNRALR